jgi:hypothetical protein
MNKNRKNFLITGLIFFLIMFFCAMVYRPYIYKNHLFDFYFADTYNNLLSIPTIFFLIAAFRNKINPYISVICIASVYIFGELFELFPSGNFDYKDIIATLIGSVLTLIIYNRIKGSSDSSI